ncbi:MAG: hypothetical protein JNM00_07160, partial [Flavobacteriales bacterium]|nr:hypothetical protein [Flavobacteriales bacterium]
MKSIYLTGFLLLNIFVVGQNYPFETMTVREGLPTNDVYAIAKDASGCMWFGCSNALVKYDGYRMESFTANDGMVASAVSALACDEDGNVWIGHGADGISVYRNGKFEKFAAKDAGQNFISALLAYDGYLYALQNKKSVRALDMANGKEVSRIDSQNDVVPYCMARPSGAYNSKGI